MLDELTVHPGETVTICVDRDYSLFSETAELNLYDASQQMINTASRSLLFAGGVTEVCFDYTVPEQASLGSYLYKIDGIGKYLKVIVEEERKVFQSGVVYFKINDNENFELSLNETFSNSNSSGILNTFSIFGVYKLDKPFAILNTTRTRRI